MADKATITKESFYKSLSKLEALAGGAVQEGMAKSQICTGPNSERRDWAGSNWENVPGDGPGADKIKPDGTDYNERGVRKSIQEKVAKGIALNATELALLKSDMEKGGKEEDEKDEKGEKEVELKFGKAQDDDDKEKFGREMGKSFNGAVQENDTLQKGIEVSEFLAELSKAFASGLEGIEARMDAKVQAVGQQLFDTLTGFASEQGEFNKSLAEAMVNIGHGVAGSLEQVEQVAQMPAGPPRSQQMHVIPGGQGFVQKSFAGQQGGGEHLSKAVVADALNDMLEKGESGISPIEIIKFDTTGELRPDLQQRVMARVNGAGR